MDIYKSGVSIIFIKRWLPMARKCGSKKSSTKKKTTKKTTKKSTKKTTRKKKK